MWSTSFLALLQVSGGAGLQPCAGSKIAVHTSGDLLSHCCQGIGIGMRRKVQAGRQSWLWNTRHLADVQLWHQYTLYLSAHCWGIWGTNPFPCNWDAAQVLWKSSNAFSLPLTTRRIPIPLSAPSSWWRDKLLPLTTKACLFLQYFVLQELPAVGWNVPGMKQKKWKAEIQGIRRTLLTALVRCKRGGRTHDGCWQGRVSSQTWCILAVRERGQGPGLTLFSVHTCLAQTEGCDGSTGAGCTSTSSYSCKVPAHFALLSLQHRTDTLHKCKEQEKSFLLF